MDEAIRVSAPVRIDFTGGYTDVCPFADQVVGKSVNAAITLYTHVQAFARGDRRVRMKSLDLGVLEEVASIDRLRPTGALGLVKRALLSSPPLTGVDLLSWSEAPSQSGLGTSGAISVAMQLVTAQLTGRSISPQELADRAARCQREHHISGGRQDEYASAFGGINYLTFHGSASGREPLKLSSRALDRLESSLLLLHGGGTHDSGALVDDVMRELCDRPERVRPHLSALNDLADEIRRCLKAGHFRDLPTLIERVFHHQQGLGERVVPVEVQELVARIAPAGASCKVLGGGGLGSALLACFPPESRDRTKELVEGEGLKAIPFGIDFVGARAVPIQSPLPL